MGARPSWRAERRSSSQVVSTAVLDEVALVHGRPSPSKRRDDRPRRTQRVLDDGECGREDLLAEIILQEAGAARDGRPVDGAEQMSDQAGGDPAVKIDRDRLRRDLARIEPPDGAVAGLAADRLQARAGPRNGRRRSSRSRAPCAVPSPAMADTEGHTGAAVALAKPLEMPMAPVRSKADAPAPPDLVTPGTARAAASTACARSSQLLRRPGGHREDTRSRSGKSRASWSGSATPA